MKILAGNRLERLLEHLAGVAARPPEDPFAPEVIVVPTPGMEKWVARELAERLGVWANPSFPFPRNFLEGVMDAFLEEPSTETGAWRRDSLAWSIFELLGRETPGETASYLEGDSRDLKRFQLARKLAHTFDQYMVFRPDLLFSWEEGAEKGDWQAEVWRSLVARHGSIHPARRMELLLEKLRAWGGPLPGGVPARVSLFGVSTLPPLFVRVLQALSRLVEVRLYLPLPSPSFLEDREATGGNPLLETMGGLYEDFVRVLGNEGALEDVETFFEEPGRDTLLGSLQEDIHLARPPSPAGSPDGTLSFHSCSSRLREVEALKDRLLLLFEEDSTLQPGDVAVLCPDLEEYAPLVEAVFGGEPGRTGFIPFHLAERSFRGGSPTAEAFLRLLEALQGRLPASQVLDILEFPPAAERFGLGPDDLERARLWVREAGIRWGEDGDHRAREGLPSFRENSWRWGLDRLLLGYALPGEGKRLYGDVLPFDDVEGSAASVLGGLCSFIQEVSEARSALEEPRSPVEWASFLAGLLERLFRFPPQESQDPAWLRDALASLGEESLTAEFHGKVDFLVFREALTRRLGEAVRRHSFLAGGVHFASLLPMRSLPFRVICLLGMNDGDFPRTETAPPFDRIPPDPRPGDRSLREDDRSLFLETILAARERLLVFWVGRSEREGGTLPPSVVVSELLDVLEEGRPGERGDLVAVHPLQPFAPRYFRPAGGLRGFQGPWLEAVRIVSGPRRQGVPFLEGEVEAEEEEQVSLERLVSFFKDPARFFLRESLGLRLEEREEDPGDREPLRVGSLEEYFLGDGLLRLGLEGIPPGEAIPIFRGAGMLPPGEGGRLVFEEAAGEVEELLERLGEARGGKALEPVYLEIPLGGTILAGRIRDLYPAGQVLAWYGRETGRRRVETWIRHLFFLLAAPAGAAKRTRFLVRSSRRGGGIEEFILAGPNDPVERMEELLDLYRLGRRVPLLFFPRQASEYLERTLDGKGGPSLLPGFRKEFREGGSAASRPEIRILYGEDFPLDPGYRHFPGDPGPTFEEAAERILGPFFRARKEVARG